MRLGILGYGNLGKGIECAVRQNADVELKAVFTRRDPATVKIQTAGVPVYHVDEVEAHKDEIDVLVNGREISTLNKRQLTAYIRLCDCNLHKMKKVLHRQNINYHKPLF